MRAFVTLLYCGYSPLAPGTVATLVAFLVYVTLRPSNGVILALIVILFPSGIYASHIYEKAVGREDPPEVVIDEFVGYLVSVFMLPQTVETATAAFFVFRFFDIIKPPPIRRIEELTGGGFSIMVDDLIAAVMTNVLLRLGLWLL